MSGEMVTVKEAEHIIADYIAQTFGDKAPGVNDSGVVQILRNVEPLPRYDRVVYRDGKYIVLTGIEGEQAPDPLPGDTHIAVVRVSGEQ